ncbi:SMI1/KNR4 family protein (plasmid) [Moellerella wisconsensis]|uniref:SMI1/KNR4 family protein n=1 Tax=Moellerella wisconsensis TaxID=158849 RepID=UPI001F4EEF4D|nr:SMI1/KNR4 family protein [Moellerella wisconsensis]UNH44164.1 SMI1/KNR4 family protein [Moellerella wisconsensis]
MKKEELIDLFNEHADLINMGTSVDAPGQEWIESAEKALSVNFPDDYKWFLNNYGGGDICGEEIYSIYCLSFDEAIGGKFDYLLLCVVSHFPFYSITLISIISILLTPLL